MPNLKRKYRFIPSRFEDSTIVDALMNELNRQCYKRMVFVIEEAEEEGIKHKDLNEDHLVRYLNRYDALNNEGQSYPFEDVILDAFVDAILNNKYSTAALDIKAKRIVPFKGEKRPFLRNTDNLQEDLEIIEDEEKERNLIVGDVESAIIKNDKILCVKVFGDTHEKVYHLESIIQCQETFRSLYGDVYWEEVPFDYSKHIKGY